MNYTVSECVYVREKNRERGREREREGGRERGREREEERVNNNNNNIINPGHSRRYVVSDGKHMLMHVPFTCTIT